MKSKYDFKKEWERIRKELVRVSKEAVVLAKKGEEEIVKISKKGKIHLDKGALMMNKEKLYYLIGKEYVNAKFPSQITPNLRKLIEDFNQNEKDINVLNRLGKSKKLNSN